jgi:hypothetical protein
VQPHFVPEHWQVLQPSTLVQVIVELHPAMGAHPARPVQLLLTELPLLPDGLPPPELLLPDEPLPLPEGVVPDEDPVLLPDCPPLLPPPSGALSSRALPPHARKSDAATTRAKTRSELGARRLMRASV